jgi:hypothetical protein
MLSNIAKDPRFEEEGSDIEASDDAMLRKYKCKTDSSTGDADHLGL